MIKTLRTLVWSSVYSVAVMVFVAAKYGKYYRVRSLRALVEYMIVFYVAWFLTGLAFLMVRNFVNRIRCEYKLYFAVAMRAGSYEQFMCKLTKRLYWESGWFEFVVSALSIPIRLPILVVSLMYDSRYVEEFLFPSVHGEYSNWGNIEKLRVYIETTYEKKLADDWISKLKLASHKDRTNLETFTSWLNNSGIAR